MVRDVNGDAGSGLCIAVVNAFVVKMAVGDVVILS